jgi:ABC-2 type transport system permease protein
MQYPASLLADLFATFLIVLTEFGTIYLVLQRFGSIGGWRLGEVALLYGMVTAAFNFMDMAFSGFDPSFFGKEIRLGSFDQALLRPVNLSVQVLGSRFILRRLGGMLNGFLILGLALWLVDITWSVDKALVAALSLAGMVAFFGGIFITGATVTFWTVEAIEGINVFSYGGRELISYPMHIYPQWLRRFFTFVLPAIFLNYYPALYLLERPDPFGLPPSAGWFAPLTGTLALLAGLRFWRFGVSKYQSTGT